MDERKPIGTWHEADVYSVELDEYDRIVRWHAGDVFIGIDWASVSDWTATDVTPPDCSEEDSRAILDMLRPRK